MLRSVIAPLVLISSLSFSEELNTEKFQLLAKNIDTKDNNVIATGDVVVFSNNYYITAGKIIYNKNNDTFELFDDVLILKDNNVQTQSNYAFVDMKNEKFDQSPVMLMDKKSNLWINSESSSREKSDISLEDSIISSCDCVDPLWSIKATSADYDTKDQWLHAYNTRLYIKDVPVFYSPYIGFPTDRTRRSGLLKPTIGFSSNEGFQYFQPIYYAPKKDWDLEFIPQIRTDRGNGLYSYFRYADSKYSLLKFKTGIFKENSSYLSENNTTKEKHFGWNLDYERTKLFSSENSQDGLYTSINSLNNIEYVTLEKDSNSTDKKIESKFNYFYDTSKYYTGLYGRYYIDTDKDNNDSTLQEFPHLQFHSYNKKLWLDRLIYSTDVRIINYTRDEGLNASVYEISLPVSYTHYLFSDFIYLNLENKTTLSRYQYSNTTKHFENGTLGQNETSIAIGTDLIKPYTNYLHTVNLEGKYVYPKNIQKDGDLYKITNDDEDLSTFPIVEGSKNIRLSLNQSLYNKEDLKQIINHKLNQSIVYDSNDELKFMDLENYIRYNYRHGSISNKTVYNIEDKHFIENSTSFNYSYSDYYFTINHYKSKETENSNKENLESLNINASYQITKDYKVSYYESYNLEDNIRSKQGVSFNINDICWNLDFKYEKEINPSSSANNGVNQNTFYIELELKPLASVKQKYSL